MQAAGFVRVEQHDVRRLVLNDAEHVLQREGAFIQSDGNVRQAAQQGVTAQIFERERLFDVFQVVRFELAQLPFRTAKSLSTSCIISFSKRGAKCQLLPTKFERLSAPSQPSLDMN